MHPRDLTIYKPKTGFITLVVIVLLLALYIFIKPEDFKPVQSDQSSRVLLFHSHPQLWNYLADAINNLEKRLHAKEYTDILADTDSVIMVLETLLSAEKGKIERAKVHMTSGSYSNVEKSRDFLFRHEKLYNDIATRFPAEMLDLLYSYGEEMKYNAENMKEAVVSKTLPDIQFSLKELEKYKTLADIVIQNSDRANPTFYKMLIIEDARISFANLDRTIDEKGFKSAFKNRIGRFERLVQHLENSDRAQEIEEYLRMIKRASDQNMHNVLLNEAEKLRESINSWS